MRRGAARACPACGDATGSMVPLDLVKLRSLMALTRGRSEFPVALMDGPVASGHPDLADARIESVAAAGDSCSRLGSRACAHGTFVAGILVANRGSAAPAICPGCTLLVRPIFKESPDDAQMPAATTQELAQAIAECVDAGARVLNLSASTAEPSTRSERGLQESLDYAASRGALVVAAAGNQGTLGSSAITRHSWVIPVVAYDASGRPMRESNFGSSIGRRGLGAPGEAIRSLGADGAPLSLGGTSFAAPFVTGAIALLSSLFPTASPNHLRYELMCQRRSGIVPPLLDASAAYQAMAPTYRRMYGTDLP